MNEDVRAVKDMNLNTRKSTSRGNLSGIFSRIFGNYMYELKGLCNNYQEEGAEKLEGGALHKIAAK